MRKPGEGRRNRPTLPNRFACQVPSQKKLMTFHRYVGVYSPAKKLLFRAPSEQAENIVREGASVYSVRSGQVSAIEISKAQMVLRERDYARRQPLGIRRTIVADSLVYSFPSPKR